MEALGQESRKLWEQGSAWPLSKSQTQGGETGGQGPPAKGWANAEVLSMLLENSISTGGTCLWRLTRWGSRWVCSYTFTH